MSRNLGIAAAGALITVALLAAAAIGFSGDPQRTVEVTQSEAAAAVSAFVGSTELVDKLSVRGPIDGAYLRLYDVAGGRVVATVDVHTGAVVTLVFGSAIGTDGEVKISDADARMTAQRFLTDHGIAMDGLVQSSRFVYHGESSEYVVEWSRHVGDVVVPDIRIVGVDASTGQVFRYVNLQRPFAPPGDPSVSKADAIAKAMELVGPDASHVENTELRVVFTVTGIQRLVWNIYLTESVDLARPGQSIPSHWVVEVDAASGDAVLLASS